MARARNRDGLASQTNGYLMQNCRATPSHFACRLAASAPEPTLKKKLKKMARGRLALLVLLVTSLGGSLSSNAHGEAIDYLNYATVV